MLWSSDDEFISRSWSIVSNNAKGFTASILYPPFGFFWHAALSGPNSHAQFAFLFLNFRINRRRLEIHPARQGIREQTISLLGRLWVLSIHFWFFPLFSEFQISAGQIDLRLHQIHLPILWRSRVIALLASYIPWLQSRRWIDLWFAVRDSGNRFGKSRNVLSQVHSLSINVIHRWDLILQCFYVFKIEVFWYFSCPCWRTGSTPGKRPCWFTSDFERDV
jgi:hypothetical protein